MRITWFSIALTAILAAVIFLSYSSPSTENKNSSAKEENVSIDRNLPQVVQSVAIIEEHQFAGERVPHEIPDVQERLERELLVNSYRHSSTIRYMKLMPRYFPLLENILKQEGVPEDFKYLAVAESGLEQVVSPAGARGLWQFMKGTAQEFDLEVNSEVDERYHVEKSTRAACTYLKKLKEQFGSWTLAAAAYNMGQNALAREMTNQKEDNYYNLNLSRETLRYILRIVALKEIHENPEKYGYYLQDSDFYKPHDEVTVVKVDGEVESLADLAHANGSTYRELKVYNPWLLTHKLSNSAGKSYYIQFPKKVD